MEVCTSQAVNYSTFMKLKLTIIVSSSQ